MAKQAEIQAPPSLVGIPRVDFISPDFDTLIYNKGLTVVIEKALPCPCAKRTKEYQASCKNCQGTGWVFINPTQTKAVVQSINKSTKYKEWSAELVGTVALTVASKNKLTYMDKIVIVDSVVVESENVIVRQYEDGSLFSYTIYPVNFIDVIFQFTGTDNPLRVLVEGVDYIVNGNKIVYIGEGILEGDSISVRYSHNLQYNVIDLNHDVRNTYQLDTKSREQQLEMPISAIARKSHYITDALNYAGTNIFDNSVK